MLKFWTVTFCRKWTTIMKCASICDRFTWSIYRKNIARWFPDTTQNCFRCSIHTFPGGSIRSMQVSAIICTDSFSFHHYRDSLEIIEDRSHGWNQIRAKKRARDYFYRSGVVRGREIEDEMNVHRAKWKAKRDKEEC